MDGGEKKRIRYRPARRPGAAARRQEEGGLVYSPVRTGCPAVETAIDRLYEAGEDEQEKEARFWALIKSLHYALQMETELLVPLETALSGPGSRTDWTQDPIPAEKAGGLRLWTVMAQKEKRFLPAFTSSAAAEGSAATLYRPAASLPLRQLMERAIKDEGLSGLVINPWGRSATLDKSILQGLLYAPPAGDEPGEAEARQGREAARAGDWGQAAACYEAAHEKGWPEGTRLLAYCYEQGRGVKRSRTQALRLWKKAAAAGDIPAQIALGDRYAAGTSRTPGDAGRALIAYRRARTMAELEPDIESRPLLCLRLAQYELRYTDMDAAYRLLAEAAHGFSILCREGDPDALPYLNEVKQLAAQGLFPAEEAEKLLAQLIRYIQEEAPGGPANTEALHLD